MSLPLTGQYIDIHTHGNTNIEDVFVVENLMAHEDIAPSDVPETTCSFGIHPWDMEAENFDNLIDKVRLAASCPNLAGIGEAGFDKLRGAPLELQRRAFTEQVIVSENVKKPLIIHCVRGWDELFIAYRLSRPQMPWLIHGFRGNIELARQLLSKGFYLSFWFDFIVRPESTPLMQNLPLDRIFLETDGADVDIRSIYMKVASDLNLTVEELKSLIHSNYYKFFGL